MFILVSSALRCAAGRWYVCPPATIATCCSALHPRGKGVAPPSLQLGNVKTCFLQHHYMSPLKERKAAKGKKRSLLTSLRFAQALLKIFLIIQSGIMKVFAKCVEPCMCNHLHQSCGCPRTGTASGCSAVAVPCCGTQVAAMSRRRDPPASVSWSPRSAAELRHRTAGCSQGAVVSGWQWRLSKKPLLGELFCSDKQTISHLMHVGRT